MTEPIQISVVIPVRNEEANLPQCLERLGRFSEVIVVDSDSTDKTPEIARACGAALLNFRWNGRFPKKRNWVLLNHRLKCNWVLFLDADELVDDRFCDAASRAVESNEHVGYWLNYTNYFLGNRLKHGVPQRKLALFKVGSGLYERIDENAWSSLDMEVHEHPVLEGRIDEIPDPIDHRDLSGIDRFIERHLNYASWEAQRYSMLSQSGDEAWAHLTKRQRFKYKNLCKWWFPYFYFLYNYLVKKSFLDGSSGFNYSFYKFWYFKTIRIMFLNTKNL